MERNMRLGLLTAIFFVGCNAGHECGDCEGSAGTGSTDSACAEDCDSENGPTASAIVTASIDGEAVDCNLFVYEETSRYDSFADQDEITDLTLVSSGKTGDPLTGIPADAMVQVWAGDESKEMDCGADYLYQEGEQAAWYAMDFRRPLHYDQDGNAWTYDTIRTSLAEGDEATFSLAFGQYLLGWFACTEHSWGWNDETWAYDIDRGVDEYDPILVKMNGTALWTNRDGAIGTSGGGGTFHTSGSSMVYVDKENEAQDEFIEDGSSYVTATSFGFVYVYEGRGRETMDCALVETATCDTEAD